MPKTLVSLPVVPQAESCQRVCRRYRGHQRHVAAGCDSIDGDGLLAEKAGQIEGARRPGPGAEEPPSPPNGCTPTTAPMMLRLM